jgi:hypothetical protein
MSLKPPSLWIEKRGQQHLVYWRNTVPGLPARSFLPFYGREAADHFVGSAALLGLDIARQVFTTEDPHAAAALVQAALVERGLAPVDSGPALVPAGPLPQSAAPGDPRLTGVTFRKLWHTFLDRQHHVEEGNRADYCVAVRADGVCGRSAGRGPSAGADGDRGQLGLPRAGKVVAAPGDGPPLTADHPGTAGYCWFTCW